MLPRVILYSSAFFCTKMAVYCLLLLLPSFLNDELGYSHSGIANLSTSIDIGAMFGSMALGYISDLMHGKRSPVALGAILISIAVSFTITFTAKDLPTAIFFILMFILGFCISGLNNMISSACSADLGK
jgi:OPA family glycerol-3-phosphate transporter-like MFS transporter 1/2